MCLISKSTHATDPYPLDQRPVPSATDQPGSDDLGEGLPCSNTQSMSHMSPCSDARAFQQGFRVSMSYRRGRMLVYPASVKHDLQEGLKKLSGATQYVRD